MNDSSKIDKVILDEIKELVSKINYQDHLYYNENNQLTYTGGLLPENGEKDFPIELEGDICVENTLGACMFFRKKDFIDNAYTLWKFAPEKKQKSMGHGSMFPPELPRRCIEMLTYENDVVLDPFAGLGTTSVAAELTNRQHIGFELSKNYCELATTRLEEIS